MFSFKRLSVEDREDLLKTAANQIVVQSAVALKRLLSDYAEEETEEEMELKKARLQEAGHPSPIDSKPIDFISKSVGTEANPIHVPNSLESKPIQFMFQIRWNASTRRHCQRTAP